MFGKKAKKIAELEGKLAQRDYADLERYNPLAADIIRRVDFEAADSDRFTSVDLETILQTVEKQYRGDKLLKLFRELPPELRLQFLLGAETDAEKLEMIQSALNEELEASAAKNTLESLIEKAKTEKRIDLSMIPSDLNVKFFLYDTRDFKDNVSSKYLKNNHWSDVKIDTVSLGDGVYRVVSIRFGQVGRDLKDGPFERSDIKFGFDTARDGEYLLEPFAYFGSGLGYSIGDAINSITASGQGYAELQLRLGRLQINKEDIFIK